MENEPKRIFRKLKTEMGESVWTMIEMTALMELIEQNRLEEAKGFILAKKLGAVRTLFHWTIRK